MHYTQMRYIEHSHDRPRPQLFWFEIFMMAHKLCLISFIPTMVADSSSSFLVIAMIFEICSLLLTSYCKPFFDPELDRLSVGTHFVTCVMLLYGIALKVVPDAVDDPHDQKIMGVVLVMLNLAVILAGPIQFAMDRAAELHEMSAQVRTATAVGLAHLQQHMGQRSARRQLSQVEAGHLAQLCSQGPVRPSSRLDERNSRVGSKIHAGVSTSAAAASLSSDRSDTSRPIAKNLNSMQDCKLH